MTAVEFLEKICNDRGYHLMEEYFEQAKEMEKQQITDAHTEGYIIGGGNGDLYNCKEYYNETYGK